MWVLNTVTLHLRTDFSVSHRFLSCCTSIFTQSRKFKFSFLIFFLNDYHLITCYLVFMSLCTFYSFCWNLTFCRQNTDVISTVKMCVINCGWFWRKFQDCREERLVFSVWVEYSVNTVNASGLWGNLIVKVFCLLFIHMMPISESGVLKPSTTTIFWSICGFTYIIIPFTKLGSPVFGMYLFRIIIFYCWIFKTVYEVSFLKSFD